MISRFCCYIEQVFDFGDRVKGIHDTRQKPRIPTSAIWSSAFFVFAMRRGSLNCHRIPNYVSQAIGWPLWVLTSQAPTESGCLLSDPP